MFVIGSGAESSADDDVWIFGNGSDEDRIVIVCLSNLIEIVAPFFSWVKSVEHFFGTDGVSVSKVRIFEKNVECNGGGSAFFEFLHYVRVHVSGPFVVRTVFSQGTFIDVDNQDVFRAIRADFGRMLGKGIVKNVFRSKRKGMGNKPNQARQDNSDEESRYKSFDFFWMLEFHRKKHRKEV
jgi:hypothetical protein